MGNMTIDKVRASLFAFSSMAALTVMSGAALATEGYFQLGFGPRQNAVGGAGVADSRDAMSLALNPAGIVGLDAQLQLGGAIFMPYRGYDATGPGFVAPGSVDSDRNIFAMPSVAYSRPLDSSSAIGVTLYGNGGMNTTYPDVANPACGGGSGVFCGGEAGVDLMQAFLSVGYAREFGPMKVGVAPTMAIQLFKAKGLGAFSAISSDAANLTNNGYDYSIGGGLKAGIEFELMQGLRFAAAGQTKMFMSKFDDYAGLFENGGDFDIPAAITAGLALDATPDLTLMLDYQHIFYSGVDAVANASTTPAPLGSKGGPGFGWKDVDVFKIGAEWRASDQWTFRAGYAYSENPISSSDVTFNILAPGVVKHHITAGASYALSANDTLEFSGMYVPEGSVSGIEITPQGPNPGRTIKDRMYQLQFLAGWTHKF
jgi:long-chain fatty acid transport protein